MKAILLTKLACNFFSPSAFFPISPFLKPPLSLVYLTYSIRDDFFAFVGFMT